MLIKYCATKISDAIATDDPCPVVVSRTGDALNWFPELETFLNKFNIHEIQITLTDAKTVFFIDRVYDTEPEDL